MSAKTDPTAVENDRSAFPRPPVRGEKPFRPLALLARHGQTVANKRGFVLGSSDSPLTNQGAETAKALARRIRDQNVESILTSPLGRAMATAKWFARVLGLSHAVVVQKSLSELSCGAWEGRLRSDVLLPGSLGLRPAWDSRPPGGESYGDGEKRIKPLVEELLARHSDRPVLVIGHAAINRVLLKLWLGLSDAAACALSFPHDAVYLLGEEGHVETLDAEGMKRPGARWEKERLF
jgi:probable phosphoglycerate mutase